MPQFLRFLGPWIVIASLALASWGCGGDDGTGRSGPALENRPAGERPVSNVRRGRRSPVSDSTGAQPLLRRQVLYVPAYAHIFFRNKDRTMNLATTLSIHNTDPEHTIQLIAVEYYNSEGSLVRQHLDAPKTLGPFASTWYVIEDSDLSGGVGANFIVEWRSEEPVSPPVVETVMISAAQTQGISFTSRARVIEQE